MILLLLLKMIMINLSDLIESKYKIIYQIMYKMKDKKRKKRMKAWLLYTWIEQNQD